MKLTCENHASKGVHEYSQAGREGHAKVNRLRIQALFLSFWLSLSPVGGALAAPDLGESLDYTLRFRGIVTGFVELDIASLNLSVGSAMAQVAGKSTYPTRMKLTTEAYRKAELIYPVRLDYRSWLEAETLQPLVAAKSLRTDKPKQELFRYDPTEGQGYHYQLPKEQEQSAGPAPPRTLIEQVLPGEETWSDLRENKRFPLTETPVIDYMAMLHQLRWLPAETGQWFDFTIFTGKKQVAYRARVERERLVRQGWDRDSLHLRLYEYDAEKNELEDEVELWISDDEQRLLLRFYADSTAGALEGILDTGRPENGHNEGLSEATRRSLEDYLDY